MRILLYTCGACGKPFALSSDVVRRMSIRGLNELCRTARIAHVDECRGVHYCDEHPTYVVLPNATQGLRPWCTAGHVANLPAVRELAPAGDRITELLQGATC